MCQGISHARNVNRSPRVEIAARVKPHKWSVTLSALEDMLAWHMRAAGLPEFKRKI